jgi:peptidoglycan hydrolase-like protein with peptidoglycan-binding domain
MGVVAASPARAGVADRQSVNRARLRRPDDDALLRLHAPGRPRSSGQLLALQRSAGNAAVVAALQVQRRGGDSSCGCGCADKEAEGEGNAQPEAKLQKRGELLVQRENIFGSAYAQPLSPAQELPASQKGEWFPASQDFQVTAAGGPGKATFDELLKHIESQGAGSISDLKVIGHATSFAGGVLALGGKIKPAPDPNVIFDQPAANITPDAVKANFARCQAARDRFAKGAKITLVGCDAGIADSLMQSLADAFGVCVKGFSTEVSWCLSGKGSSLDRGKVTNTLDPLTGKPAFATCAGIGSLNPDKEKCPKPGGGGATPGPKLCVPIPGVEDTAGGGGSTFELTSSIDAAGASGGGADLVAAAELIGLKRGDGMTFGTIDLRPRVVELQQRLNAIGFGIVPDGKFGGGTAAALTEFQQANSLTPQEEVDPETAGALTGGGASPALAGTVEGLKKLDGMAPGTAGRRQTVRKLQGILDARGFTCKVDGKYGEGTANALREFQQSEELEQGGDLVDQQTAAALEGDGTCPPGRFPVPVPVVTG